jgi:hypothetical protein
VRSIMGEMTSTLASNYWTKSFIESFKYIKNLDEE